MSVRFVAALLATVPSSTAAVEREFCVNPTICDLKDPSLAFIYG